MKLKKEDPLVRDRKLPSGAGWSSVLPFVLIVFIGLPVYFTLVLPLFVFERILRKLIGFKSNINPLPSMIVNHPEVKDKERRSYDLVLFGATGFTGKLAAQYLAKNYGMDIRWAIAGRNKEALNNVKKQLITINPAMNDLTILFGDVSQLESLKSIVADTKVVASTVGPFTLYGSPLVSLCAQFGTSYCDITGEPDWIRKMIHEHHSTAQKTGARIVHMAGHDSIPWDISTQAIAKQLKAKGESLSRVRFYNELRAQASGGTLETIMLIMNSTQKAKYDFDPLVQDRDGKKSESRTSVNHAWCLRWSSDVGKWIGPSIMAAANGCCVKRSNAILGYSGKLEYSEYDVFPGFMAGFNQFFGLLFIVTAILTTPFRWLLKTFVLPKPGSGPSKETMDKGFLRVRGVGTGNKGSVVNSMIYFPTDPGYRDTARMLVETGLALALDEEKLPIGGGVLTPACIADILIDRLVHTGCLFTIH